MNCLRASPTMRISTSSSNSNKKVRYINNFLKRIKSINDRHLGKCLRSSSDFSKYRTPFSIFLLCFCYIFFLIKSNFFLDRRCFMDIHIRGFYLSLSLLNKRKIGKREKRNRNSQKIMRDSKDTCISIIGSVLFNL